MQTIRRMQTIRSHIGVLQQSPTVEEGHAEKTEKLIGLRWLTVAKSLKAKKVKNRTEEKNKKSSQTRLILQIMTWAALKDFKELVSIF